MLQATLSYTSPILTIGAGDNLAATLATDQILVPETVLCHGAETTSMTFDESDSILIRRVRIRSLFSGYWKHADIFRGNNAGFIGMIQKNVIRDVDEWVDCNFVLPFTTGTDGKIHLESIESIFLANETSQSISASWFFEAEAVYGVPVYA